MLGESHKKKKSIFLYMHPVGMSIYHVHLGIIHHAHTDIRMHTYTDKSMYLDPSNTLVDIFAGCR